MTRIKIEAPKSYHCVLYFVGMRRITKIFSPIEYAAAIEMNSMTSVVVFLVIPSTFEDTNDSKG